MSVSQRIRRFMESLVILTWAGQLVRFRFNAAQEIIWAIIAPMLDRGEPIWLIFLKARQEGVSTFTQALAFALLFMYGNAESRTLAHDQVSSDFIFNMTKRFYEHLDLPKAGLPKKKVVEYPTEEGILTWLVMTAGSKHKGRGQTLRGLHLSELAFWPNDTVYLGVMQAVPNPPVQTLVVVESTANGRTGDGELFYNLWKRAGMERKSKYMKGFTRIFLPWFALPDYTVLDEVLPFDLDEEEKALQDTFKVSWNQLAWRRFCIEEKCQGDLNRFHQEYPAYPSEAFISSGLPAFDPHDMLRQQANVIPPQRWTVTREGVLVPHTKGELRVWPQRTEGGRLQMPPLPGHRYIGGVDTAQGEGGNLGGDDEKAAETRSWAAASFWDIDTLEQVGEWHAPTPAYEFAKALHVVCTKMFERPMLNIEVNFLGRFVQDTLKETYRYFNLHPWKGRQDRVVEKNAILYGWDTVSYSRGYLIGTAQEYIHEGKIVLRSETLLEQLSHFTKIDGGKSQCDLNDDCAIAAMLAWRSRQENFYPKRHYAKTPAEANLQKLGITVVSDPGASWARHWDRVSRAPKQPWSRMGERA